MVLDLSLSILDDHSGIVRGTLQRLVETNAPVGLVIFSDVPYELLPPGTPASELKPVIRLLRPPAGGKVVNPWTDAFRAGTRISTALQLARDMLEGDKVKNGSILLVSDLETAPDDVPETARVLRAIQRQGMTVRLLALGPSSDARSLFGGILGPKAFTPLAERPDSSWRFPRPAGVRSRRLLLLLGALLLAALAAHERFASRLALPPVRRRGRREGAPRQKGAAPRGRCGAACLPPCSSRLVAVDVARWRTTCRRTTSASARPRKGQRSGARACSRRFEPARGSSTSTTISSSAGRCSSSAPAAWTTRPCRTRIWRPPDRRGPVAGVDRRNDPDPAHSSRAANFLGVISIAAYNAAPSGASDQDRSELLLNAIASFEQAIELDPENDDAKYNLQLMLARGQGLLPTEASAGRNPLPGGRGARGAGAGEPGSGY